MKLFNVIEAAQPQQKAVGPSDDDRIETYSIFSPTEVCYQKRPEMQGDFRPLPIFPKGVLLDTVALQGHKRAVRTIMGLIVGNATKNNVPASRQYFGYNLNFCDVPFDNANALHIHKTTEIFTSFSGDFEIAAGVGGRAKVLLKKHDLVVVPPFIKRSFRCRAQPEDMHECEALKVAEEINADNCAQILTTLLGEPMVQWSPETVKKARQNGVRCSDAGLLYDEGTSAPVQPFYEELDCTQEELEACVLEARDGQSVEVPHGDANVRFEYVDAAARVFWHAEPDRNYVVFVLKGPSVTIHSCAPGEDYEGEERTEVLSQGHVSVITKRHWRLSCQQSDPSDDSLVFLISANVSRGSYSQEVLDQLKRVGM